MKDTAFYKPHAMLAFYKTSKAPKERIKRELTERFGLEVDYICMVVDNEDTAHKKAKEISLNIEDFTDINSLTLALAFYRICSEKVDYYRRKKSVEFAKAFDEHKNMTAKAAIEELKSLNINYQDNRKSIKEMNDIEEISKYFKGMF